MPSECQTPNELILCRSHTDTCCRFSPLSDAFPSRYPPQPIKASGRAHCRSRVQPAREGVLYDKQKDVYRAILDHTGAQNRFSPQVLICR